MQRIWPGSTVVCIASGPSLTREDVDCVRGKARVIVVNSSYVLAPWADVLYACDRRWWRWYPEARAFTGMKFALDSGLSGWGVVSLTRSGASGLERDPSKLKTGLNSGYQAINLAVHFGAARILLLGYDMKRGPKGQEHWHADHPNRERSSYSKFVRAFNTIVAPLEELGVQVINCSRDTALTQFPRQTIEQALEASEVAA